VSPATADPFGTDQLRAATLAAWRSSPTRLREDANLERDYALGAYRDRLIVELAQNASDAARAAGVPGRLLLRVERDRLVAANVGAPLDRAGVESLAAMRASNKDAGATGRFGVGFAAVLSVTDAPRLLSLHGGVRFDRDETRRLAASDGVPSLPESLDVPVLRLPLPDADPPPDGYDTAVVLPWRDDDARALAIAALAEIDDALLLSLPHLDEVLIELDDEGDRRRHHWQISRDSSPTVVVQDGVARHWSLTTIAGGVSEADEERLAQDEVLRRRYQATVAVPVDADGRPVPPTHAQVAHAPTPTDDPLQFPALMIADLPLDATRRRVVESERASEVLDALATGYASAVLDAGRTHGPSAAAALIPEPHALIGWVDQAVRDGVRRRLERWPLVSRAGDAVESAPAIVGEVAALEPARSELAAVLGRHLSDLLHPEWYPFIGQLRALGLPTRSVAEVWEVAATLAIPPGDWREIYDAAASLGPAELEGLPVPLADGRVVVGARGVIMAPPDAALVALLGVDCVHPDAAHPLLSRLGAVEFSTAAVLDERFAERVADAVETDPVRAREMAGAAALLAARDGSPRSEALLGHLPVPLEGGGWAAAASVVLPGSTLDHVAAPDRPRLAAAVITTESRDGWVALGVLAELASSTLVERPLDPPLWESLVPDGGSWCLAVADLAGVDDPSECMVLEAVVVRGAELLEGSERALELLAAPDVSQWLEQRTTVLTGDGRRVAVPSPSAWWLGESPLLDGRCPVDLRLPGDERLAPFFALAPALPGGRSLLRALGARTSLDDWLATASGVDELLDLLADPTLSVDADALVELYRALSVIDHSPEAPDRVRACVGDDTVVVDADQVLVAVAPHHAAVLAIPFIPGPPALADLLDLETTTDAACGAASVTGTGEERPVPDLPIDTAATYREHDDIEVAGTSVDWWVTDRGEVHATTLDGLARGLAWAGGCWSRRFEIALRLEHPESGDAARLESYFD
jgi:hypothetical protein